MAPFYCQQKRKEKENLLNSSKKMGDSRYRVPLLRGLLVNAVRYEDNRILTEAIAIIEYRRIPVISPGLIQFRKGFWVGL